MSQEREEAFVRAFIIAEKQSRYLQLLANPKRRDKVLGDLYHVLPTVTARTFEIADRDNTPQTVDALLRRKGAGPTCYLISPEDDLDQQEMPLWTALDALISQDGVAVVCCIPGRLAYYKGEREQYILEHKPQAA